MPWPSSLAAWIQGALHLSLPKQGRWHRSAIAAFQADAPFQLQGSSQPLPSLGHPASRGFGCQSRSPMEPPSGPPALVPGRDRGCHLAGAAGAVGDSSPRQSQRLPSLGFFGWFRNQDSESSSSCVTSAPRPTLGQTSFPRKPRGQESFILAVGKFRTQGRRTLLLPTTAPHSFPVQANSQSGPPDKANERRSCGSPQSRDPL